jgi:hypothetical protein
MEIVLCYKPEYMYFKEYIQTFLPGKILILYDETISKIIKPYTCWCIRRIPFSILNGQQIKFINTEQLSVPSKLEEYNKYALPGIEIYDYSKENIRISGKGTYLPYTEVPRETEKLKRFLTQKKEYDFAVIGTPSQHRLAQIEKIIKKGYTVKHIHGWDDERDIQVGKCRNFLNIHYNPDYKLYEPIRCERWRFAGMPIYSEECLDLPDGITIIDFDTFKLDK